MTDEQKKPETPEPEVKPCVMKAPEGFVKDDSGTYVKEPEEPNAPQVPEPPPLDENSTFLTREEILKKDDVIVQPLWIEEWETWIYIRVLDGQERDAFDDAVNDDVAGKIKIPNYKAWAASKLACDKHGHRIFSDEDIPLLGQKSGTALLKIVAAGQKLNQVTEDDIEIIAKNFESSLSVNSGTP